MASALPKNILVADEDDARSLHAALLVKRLEYNVFVAANGEDLVRITNRIIPHLILLDIRMPFVGWESCLEMLRSDTLLRMIKVISVADEKDRRLLEDSLKKGANAYLARPLRACALYSTIQKLTETHPRLVPRLRVIFKVTLHAGETGRACYATMLSEQGLFIRSVNPLPDGTMLKLSLELPGSTPLALEGEVIFTRPLMKDGWIEPGMGVKFINMNDGLRDALKRFIEDQLSVDMERDSLI
ncbi:MAG: PilZ domain-containing protein [Deltaproteobacteria bacterium]|nr:PilZ domain-containing protein [Deltaproteobacteria bacterium]